ncbi:STAS domain-containing protein [Kitasatospora sp. NPDC059646]|uniref:STAS domain-containing protein n=1 Tax=Kitasatospora sp. NPDC059646 TaxID=3346893 RepID=UPI0036A65C13
MDGVGVASTPLPAAAARPVDGPPARRHPEVCPGLELSDAEPTEQGGPGARFAAAGCLCRNTAKSLRDRIHDLADQGFTRLVVDLNGVGHLDGPGLGALVGGLRLLRPKDGTLGLAVADPHILKVLRATGLVKVFDIHRTAPEPARPPARAA